MPTTYRDDHIVSEGPFDGTCPTEEDPATYDDFEVGDHIHRLRYENGNLGNCYHDRTMRQFMATSRRMDGRGPMMEDMSSYRWPSNSATVALTRFRDGHYERVPINQLRGNRNVLAVYLPKDMTVLKGWTFADCTGLKRVSLPKNLQRINMHAFWNTGVERLILPESLNNIEVEALPKSLQTVIYEGFQQGRNKLDVRGTTDMSLAVARWIGGAAYANLFFNLASMNTPPANVKTLELLSNNAFPVNLALCPRDPFSKVVHVQGWRHDAYKDILMAMLALPSADAAVQKFNAAAANGGPSAIKILAKDVVTTHEHMGSGKWQHAEAVMLEMLKAALAAGLDATIENFESTPLLSAAYGRHTELVRVLLPYADVNQTCGEAQETALMVAAYEGDLETVKVLVEAGADITIKDNSGMTAEMIALEQGNREVAEYLGS